MTGDEVRVSRVRRLDQMGKRNAMTFRQCISSQGISTLDPFSRDACIPLYKKWLAEHLLSQEQLPWLIHVFVSEKWTTLT